MLKQIWGENYRGDERGLYKPVAAFINRELIGSLVIQLESSNLKAFPDFLILYKGKTYYVELKKNGFDLARDLSTRHGREQVVFLEDVRKTGNRAKFISSFRDLKLFVETIKKEGK